MTEPLDLDALRRKWRDLDRHTVVPQEAFDLIEELRATRADRDLWESCAEDMHAVAIHNAEAAERAEAAIARVEALCAETPPRECDEYCEEGCFATHPEWLFTDVVPAALRGDRG